MIFYQLISLLIGVCVLFPASTLAKSNTSSIEFFASNNAQILDLQTAFNRLQGEEQQALQKEIIKLMQKEHIEQSTFENVLGTYIMSADQNSTADNSEKVITSSYQKIAPEKIFKIAKKLAKLLKQESIAVFIPTPNPKIGDVILKLKSHSYTINETIKIIREELPAKYSQAFSLHLNNSYMGFDNSTVDEVEWLGSFINPEEVKKSFPQEEIKLHYGKAYLIYKDGTRELL